jgi:MarR-like DNA-binding transcriptional regulator SgrR of sgrS sRNA
VKWHDGKPFTARDVQCTWRMLIGKSEAQEFHRNPRKVWYSKLQDVSINGDYEATFELSEPQPSLPVLLASAFSAVYPCHVPQATMRTKPIGTGPFKFVEFKRGASIRLVRNPDYWKKGPPLSGRDHFQDDRQPRHAHVGFRDRRIRHHLPRRRQRFPDEGHQGASAKRDMREDHHRHSLQPDGEPGQPAVRQSGY